MGFLIGDVYRWNGKEYTCITMSIPLESISTGYRVEPKKNSLAMAISRIEKTLRRKMIVGWYHSHPNFGCFMSPLDIQTQRNFFFRSYHTALVIDPIRNMLDFFKLYEESYRRASYAVYRKVKAFG
jgi:proteasome lid subunit RPN8/RPN11